MARRNKPDPGDASEQHELPEDSEPAAVTAAAGELYSAEPDRFADLRSALVAQARERGDADAAKLIAKLRKPTTAAWIVNRQVHEDGSLLGRVLDMNDRLRGAHEDLDAELLRDLSAERRRFVDELTGAALGAAGRADAPAQLRDEVRSTFDAAVADPSIAMQLGRLQRSQSWSGFGVAAPTGPALTVLLGGRGGKAVPPPSRKSTERAPSKPPKPPRALVAARTALTDAEAVTGSAEAEERTCAQRVDSLTARLSDLEAELGRARTALDQARKAARAARARQREAQAALNRAERASKR